MGRVYNKECDYHYSFMIYGISLVFGVGKANI